MIALDSNGSIYVVDAGNHKIRKIVISGNSTIVTTIAGTGSPGYVDSPSNASDGTAVAFNSPYGIAIDSDGILYISDHGNSVIRKVMPSGVTSTLAGSGYIGYVDGIGTAASFWGTGNITIDDSDSLYVGDANHVLRKITKDGVVTTTSAYGLETAGMTVSPSGAVIIGAGCNIYSVTVNSLPATVSHFAGSGCGYVNGPTSEAKFNWGPHGLAIAANGDLLVADTVNHLIRRVSPAP